MNKFITSLIILCLVLASQPVSAFSGSTTESKEELEILISDFSYKNEKGLYEFDKKGALAAGFDIKSINLFNEHLKKINAQLKNGVIADYYFSHEEIIYPKDSSDTFGIRSVVTDIEGEATGQTTPWRYFGRGKVATEGKLSYYLATFAYLGGAIISGPGLPIYILAAASVAGAISYHNPYVTRYAKKYIKTYYIGNERAESFIMYEYYYDEFYQNPTGEKVTVKKFTTVSVTY